MTHNALLFCSDVFFLTISYHTTYVSVLLKSLKQQRQRSPFIPRTFSLSKEAINFGLLESFAVAIALSRVKQRAKNTFKYQGEQFSNAGVQSHFLEISDQERIDRTH